MSKIVKTKFFEKAIKSDYYDFLKNNIQWQEGIYSYKKKTMTRLAYNYGFNSLIDPYILQIVNDTLKIIEIANCTILGIYLNYYRNGFDFCPKHSHPKTVQVVISFGCERVFKISNKEYIVKNGDVVIFGSSVHEIVQDENIKDGRISIAVFLEIN